MKIQTQQLENSLKRLLKQQQEQNAVKLEEVIVQMNRTIKQVTTQRDRFIQFQHELQAWTNSPNAWSGQNKQ
jgi:hypothetical protein